MINVNHYHCNQFFRWFYKKYIVIRRKISENINRNIKITVKNQNIIQNAKIVIINRGKIHGKYVSYDYTPFTPLDIYTAEYLLIFIHFYFYNIQGNL